jgi:hypothetical protein
VLTLHRGGRLLLLAVLTGALLVHMLVHSPVASAETVQNASGRYDSLVLRDLGGRTAALVQLVAVDGAFTPVELWRSKKGKFDVARAAFVAGDVNGDGIGDGIVLYDLGKSRSRLLVYLSDGMRARQTTAWTSRRGAFAKSRARIAVGDVDRDGLDDVIALCARGKSGATLYRFVSTGTKFRQTTGWSARRGYAWSRTQLAAGDVSGDGRDDALVLYKRTSTSSRLDVFVAGSSRFSKKTFWSGRYPAGRARLAAGDVDSDGDCDAVCLRSGRLEVFRSSGKSFTGPATWATGAPATSRFGVGDITGDGRGDVVTGSAAGSAATRFGVWTSTGSAFVARTWWQGAWPATRVRLGVAPAPGIVVSDATTVLDQSSVSALRKIEENGTFVFADASTQLDGVQKGDVLVAAPSTTFPGGLARKVTNVTTQSGKVMVATAQATLCDVLDQGEVALSFGVTREDLTQDGVVLEGARLAPREPPLALTGVARGEHTEGFGFDISSTLFDVAEVEGTVWLDPDAYVDWDIGWGGLQSMAYTQTLTTETDLSVSLKKAIGSEKKKTLYKKTLTVITIMVGPVPVIVTPEFEVYIGVDGEVTAGVTAGMSLTATATVGIGYDDDDGWSSTTSFSREATPDPPHLFSDVELRGFLGAGLSFEVYSVAGPEAKVEPYVKLAADASPTADPWWTLSAGLDAEIGCRVEAFDLTIAEKTYALHLFEYVIDQAGSGSAGGGTQSHYQAPSVRGKVLDDADGAALRGAGVELRAGAGNPGGTLLRSCTSAADGSYVFSGLSAGSYTVVASKMGCTEAWRSVTVVAGQVTTGQDLRLVKWEDQGIDGRLVSAVGGAPIPDGRVQLYEGAWTTLEDYFWHYVDTDLVDDLGRFEFLGLAAGTYTLVGVDSEHFFSEVVVTVADGRLTTQDVALIPHSAQGVTGAVVDDLTSDPIEGAVVTLHEGHGAPAGPLYREGATSSGGTFAFTGAWWIEAGPYTLTVEKDGYLLYYADVTVQAGTIADAGTIRLREPGGGSMRAPDNEASIRWSQEATMPVATYEVWYRPTAYGVMEYGGQIVSLTVDYPDWLGQGPHRWPIMSMRMGSRDGDVVFEYWLHEDDGTTYGTSHVVTGTTPVQLGHWYHLAVQHGASGGMRLYVNGALEAWDSDFEGAPEAGPGATPGGWFSLGGNEAFPGHQTAMGDYRGLRVSAGRRYGDDFTPPFTPGYDETVVIYDELLGSTDGDNQGFVPTP